MVAKSDGSNVCMLLILDYKPHFQTCKLIEIIEDFFAFF